MTKRTNQRILVKGIKYMALALPLLFLSPYTITLAALNKDNWTLYLFLSVGIVLGILAIFFIYKGINTIMKSIF